MPSEGPEGPRLLQGSLKWQSGAGQPARSDLSFCPFLLFFVLKGSVASAVASAEPFGTE